MNARKPAGIAMLLSLFAFPVAAQQGSYDIRGCGTTEATVIDKAGDVVILHTVNRGMVDATTPGAPFDKTAYECRGVLNASPSGAEFNSRCVFVDKDGHKTVGASAGTPKGWQWKFLGGTGKWEGISGGGDSGPDAAYARLSPSVNAGCWRAKGTYTLKRM